MVIAILVLIHYLDFLSGVSGLHLQLMVLLVRVLMKIYIPAETRISSAPSSIG